MRISIAPDGAEGNADSTTPKISSDGRYIVFASLANNLAPEDLNYAKDVFLRDLVTGETRLVSVDAEGIQFPNSSDLPVISGDGNFVAYRSGGKDIYLYDVQTRRVRMVDVDSQGEQGECSSGYPSLSAFGRYIAFKSCDENLVPGVTGEQIYWRDFDTGEIALVSQSGEGNVANSYNYNPSISANGRYVVFSSLGNNLVAGDTNGAADVFIRDIVLGTTELVSIGLDGSPANNSSWPPVISADGRYVAFTSYADNLVEGDTNGETDIFVSNLQTNEIIRVNVDNQGNQANDWSEYPSISNDGRYVAFMSYADNLVAASYDGSKNVFVRDLLLGATSLISVDPEGTPGNGDSTTPAISYDGGLIIFASSASTLVSNDYNNVQDIFMVSREGLYSIAPANDDFDAAVQVASLPYWDIQDTIAATTAVDDPEISCGATITGTQSQSIWYQFTPAASGEIAISLKGSSYDTVLAVWTGERDDLTEAACNDDAGAPQSVLAMPVMNSTTYWIEAAQSGVTGGGRLQIQIDDVPLAGLRGEYYANPTLQPPVALVHKSENVDFDWGANGPAYEVGVDNFSARWSGQVQAEFSETYTFYTYSDDGVRLWVDGQLLIDNWTEHTSTMDSGTISLTAGQEYDLRLEYFEHEDDAVIRLEWDSPSLGGPQVIPIDRLAPPDFGGSSIEAPLTSQPSNGMAEAVLDIRIADAGMNSIVDVPIYLWITGNSYWINGKPASSGKWTLAGISNASGEIHPTLATDLTEIKRIYFRAGDTTLDYVYEIEYLPTQFVEIPGLRGDYSYTSPPPIHLSRYGETIDLHWFEEEPEGYPDLLVYWTGQVESQFDETYTFYILSNGYADLWVDNQPIGDSDSIEFQAGEKYDLRLDYYGWLSSAEIRLEWESEHTTRQLVPLEQLSYSKIQNSTIEAYSDVGENYICYVTVDLRDPLDVSFVGAEVDVQVDGTGAIYDGEPVSDGGQVSIGISNSYGSVSAEFYFIQGGVKTFHASVEGVSVPGEASCDFPPLPVDRLQVLRADKPVFVGQPITLTIQAIDVYSNTVTDFNEIVGVTTTLQAQIPSSITLENGQATILAEWKEAGTEELFLYGPSDPYIEGYETFVVSDTLRIANNQTMTLDDVRMPFPGFITAGTVTLPITDTLWILPGHEILIVQVLGGQIGTNELVEVDQITPQEITFTEPIQNDYDGIDGKVVLQLVPYYPNIIVESGGRLTGHYWNGNTGGIVALHAENITVQQGGSIIADGMGFSFSNNGPGAGSSGGSGASHGGYGASNGNLPYGSATEPQTFGSAGNHSNGGGSIRLLVENTLQVDGVMSANGRDNYINGWYYGAGAGGSIWITTDTYSGTGVISANGGTISCWGVDCHYLSSGAGGRIAIHYSINTFNGTANAFGGDESSEGMGGPGTIYLENKTTGHRKLQVDNNNHHHGYWNYSAPPAGITDPAATIWQFDQIELKRRGNLKLLDPEDTIILTMDNMAGDKTSRLYLANDLTLDSPELRYFSLTMLEGTNLTLPQDFTLRGVNIDSSAAISGVITLTLAADGTTNSVMLLDALGRSSGQPPGVYSFGVLNISTNQTLKLASNPLDGKGVTLHARNALVGGSISANGLGYTPANNGPGVPLISGAGAGHGGYGGSTGGGLPYGSVFEPISLGSATDYSGGGAIRLVITDTLLITGTISADGWVFPDKAGGAGGSIWLEAGRITGNGTVRANGRSDESAGGAGGRIAAYFIENNFTGVWEAYGGKDYYGSKINGGAGTIYFENTFTGYSKLVVDNKGADGPPAAITDPDQTTWHFDELNLFGMGNLEIFDPEDTISLDETVINGDNTGQLYLKHDFTYDQSRIRKIGFYVSEGVTLSLPISVTVMGAELTNYGTMDGPITMTLAADSGTNSQVLLSAKGNNTGQPAGTYDFDKVTINSNQKFLMAGDPLTGQGVTLSSNRLIVAGHLSADAQGYTPAFNGPGAPLDPDSGASHGGAGGGSGAGPIYGSLKFPDSLGSASFSYSEGGGAIRLIVAEELSIPAVGKISSNGAIGMTPYSQTGDYSGAAGGSIWITAESVTGEGEILAKGMYAASYAHCGGGGGGGRIAVYAQEFLDPRITINADGGSACNPGSQGTIYLGIVDPVNSTLEVFPDNVTADGESFGTILVVARDSDGDPLADKPIVISLESGGSVLINGQYVIAGQSINVGVTNGDGIAAATISAYTTGERRIRIHSGQTIFQQEGAITFIPGPMDPNKSKLVTYNDQAPADGITPVIVFVTALDAYENPIPGLQVSLSASGSAVVTQPTEVTDENGTTSGEITDTVSENVTVSASIDGTLLSHTLEVQFGKTDITPVLLVPSETGAGSTLIYTVGILNTSVVDAKDSQLTLTLPSEVTFVSQTSPVEPEQEGNTLTWDLGDIGAHRQVSFHVNVTVHETVPTGSILTSATSVSTSTTETDVDNNEDTATTRVVEVYTFSSSITPASSSLGAGGSTAYTIHLRNTGVQPDHYEFSASGLNPGWISFAPESITLAPGAVADVKLTVSVASCEAQQTIPFSVLVSSQGSGSTTNLAAQLSIFSAPVISIDAPDENMVSASNSLLFTWRTSPDTTGVLTVSLGVDPVQTFMLGGGINHSVQVDNLQHNTSYTGTILAVSACGSNTLTRHFRTGNGIVFTNHSSNITIDRDYNQLVEVSVRNNDTISHTLTASILNPYEDLIVNFVDSGSVDQTITLQGGETRNVTLTIHAQDAQLQNYQLTAHLVADEGSTPIVDNAVLNVQVLAEGNFTIQEDQAAFNELTLARTYILTNHGKTITDLALSAIDPATNEPAKILLQPSLDHARLENGQSIRVLAYPIYSLEDVDLQGSVSNPRLALTRLEDTNPISFIMQGKGAGNTVSLPGSTSCPSGKSIYPVTIGGCTMSFKSNDWYCTNRPSISTPMQIPAFLNQDSVSTANLSLGFAPQNNVQPHSGQISFNGYQVGSFIDMIPDGQFNFPIPMIAWNNGVAGIVSQNIQLSTQHSNPGHYVSSTGYQLDVSVDEAITFVCAASQEAAQEVAEQTYACQAGKGFDPETDVYDGSVLNLGEIKALIKSSIAAVAKEFGVSVVSCTQDNCGDPINTRTGVFSFGAPDLSFPTSAGDLIFQRAYSSGATGIYTTTLGYGWTHNHAARLVFPTETGGMEGYVLFQADLGNRHLFKIEEDGSFTPGPGVLASLTKSSPAPITYTVVTTLQTEYEFDENGRILSRSDAQGHSFAYSYDEQGYLIRISADYDERYLTLDYDEQGRIVSVSDHSGRQVTYGYNAAGDLVTSTDVLTKLWSYSYDYYHHLTRVIDPSEKTTVKTDYDMSGRAYRQFDGNGKLIVRIIYNADGSATIYDANGKSQTHRYNDHNVAILKVDQLSRQTDTTYSENFRPTRITNAAGQTLAMQWSADGKNLLSQTNAAGEHTGNTYDSLNNLTSTTDSLGNLTQYSYDGKLLLSKTDALTHTTTYSYTLEGFLSQETDPQGRKTSYTYDSHGQRTSVTDVIGNTTTYTYDDLGRLTDTTDPRGRVTHNEYDAAGQLLRATRNYDPARPQNDENLYNLVTAYQYDKHGNQTAVTDTYGRTTHYEYDSADRLIRTTDPAGNVSTNTYDDAGRLTQTTDALGRTTKYVYDATGRRLSTIDALGHSSGAATFDIQANTSTVTDILGRSTTFYYDPMGRTNKVVDALSGVVTTTYDLNGNVLARADQLGRTTRYEYDELNRLVRSIDPLGGVTETEYDSNGNRAATIDPLGKRTTYTYDDFGRLVAATNPLGAANSTEYDEFGRQKATVDAAGHRTTYTYDLLDRTIAVTDPLSNTTTTEYDALGNAISRTDANGNTTYTVYDELGRVESTIDAQSHTTTNTYDAVGNLIATTDALSKTTTTTYDALNRRVAVTDPSGNTTRYTYDELGNLTDQTDANGIVTHYQYDALNRQVAVVRNYRPTYLPDAETNVRTEFAYNAVGNRLAVKDPNGKVTAFEYDALNRLTKKTDPLGNTWQYTYDLAGNRISMTDGNAKTTGFTYDAGRQLTVIDYPNPEVDVTFTYTVTGQRVSMTDGLGITTWDYDDLGRLVSATDPSGNEVAYTYDAAGNRTGLEYPDGKQVTYTYDEVNRLTAVADWADQTTQYHFDPLGQLLDILRPNGVDSSYSYDEAGRLIDIEHTGEEGVLTSFQYQYDAMGNRIQALEHLAGGVAGPTLTITVADTTGAPLANKSVYAFDGTTYTGYSKVTDAQGQASITLPGGAYRFRVDVDGVQFWSGAANHCTIGNCSNVLVTVPQPVLVSVQDTDGAPKEGLSVYAFDGSAYTGYSGVTNVNGQVSLRLPQGDYRFRTDFNGAQFWSGSANHCSVPQCTLVSLQVTVPVIVSVQDDIGTPLAGISVYAFDGSTYTNFSAATGIDGRASFTLPQGSYRFRADFNGTQFWSGSENHCTLPGCTAASIQVSQALAVTVQDTAGDKKSGVSVYAFDGSTYTSYSTVSDGNGQAFFTLPQGSYRFRADFNDAQFWSGSENHCTSPGCSAATITVTLSTQVTVSDTDGSPKPGLPVYVFDGATYKNYSGSTNANGQVVFTLPQGSYRFRADFNGTQFWSGTGNHCTVPGCDNAAVTVTKPVTVTVLDTDNAPKSGLNVYAFDGSTYTNFSKVTNASGQAIFTLPQGSYRFRADLNGTQFWSGTGNHCSLPGCESTSVIVTIPVVVTVTDGGGTVKSGVNVYAFNGATYTNFSKTTDASGQAAFTLPQGSYRFRADYDGAQYWSGETNHCAVPGCLALTVVVGPQSTATPTSTSTPEATPTTTGYLPGNGKALAMLWIPPDARLKLAAPPVASLPQQFQTYTLTVTVQDTDGAARAGLNVYAFDGATYTGFSGVTGDAGQAIISLPEGDYRFRADFNGTQFWSGASNHCSVPECETATVTVTRPVTVTVRDTDGTAQSGLNLYAFDGTTYTNYQAVTNPDGQAVFTLPEGAYRFRADLNGVQFWSGSENHCAVPGCTSAEVTVTLPVTVTVLDTDGAAQPGLNVYAFDGNSYTNYQAVTGVDGVAMFTLPQGAYRFRADLNGTQFWSGAENHCTLPGCRTAFITVTKPLVVSVKSQTNLPYPNLPVYVFSAGAYTGYNAVTDLNGEASFTLPQGAYRFRADYDGVQFWSGSEDACQVPGCLSAAVILPGGKGQTNLTIDYRYDALGRLVSAIYSDGTAFGYTYDPAGNVLSYESTIRGQSVTTAYTYDAANQLSTATANGVSWEYAYDGNGNLVQSAPNGDPTSGAKRYTYNTAGYLTQVETYGDTSWEQQAVMSYDGLGERLAMTAYAEGQDVTTHYALDNGQALIASAGDQTTFYLYGLGPIAELTDAWSYSLSDGSTTPRHMTDAGGKVTLTASYTPWGDLLSIEGEGGFTWGYFGGIMDTATSLIYLGNGQYYDPATGRFLTRNARPDQGNPYVPWQVGPLGSLISPLALLALIYGRKRKRSKWDTLAILLVFGATMGMSLSACNGNGPTAIRTTEFSATITPMPATTPHDTQMYAVTVTPTLPSSPGPGVLTPTYTCTVTFTPTPTPIPTETIKWLPEDFFITHYATVLESDDFFPEESGWIPFYDSKSGDITYKEVPKWRFYLGNNCIGNCGNWSVYFQGSGKLTLPESLAFSGGMQYVQTDRGHLPPPSTTGYQQSASYRFTDQPYGACGISFPLIPDATIAVPESRFSLTRETSDSDDFVCGDKYYIKEFGNILFTVTDRGSFDDRWHFDIYVGEQTYNSFYANFKTGIASKVAKVQGVP